MRIKEYINISKYTEILHMTRFELAFCIFYFILALIICAYSTPRGSLISADSTAYILNAENFLSLFPNYYAGPIYPALIAILMGLGLTSEQSAGLVPIIFYSLLGFPLFLIGKIVSRPMAGYITCIISLLCGKYLLYISTYAWTDMPYLFFSALVILFILIYNKYRILSSITFAGLFVSLSFFIRSVSIALIPVGIIVIMLNNKGLKNSLFAVVHYGFIPIALIILRIITPGSPGMGLKLFNPRNSNLPLDLNANLFMTYMKTLIYNDYKQTMLIILIIILIFLIYIWLSQRLIIFIKNTVPITSYLLIYSITVILATANTRISINVAGFDFRYVVPIYPFLFLLIVSLFIFVYDSISNRLYKATFKAISVVLLICLVAQGSNATYSMANDIRTQSVTDYTDRDGLNRYMLEYNLTVDNIYIDKSINWPNLQMARFSHQTRHQDKLIENENQDKLIENDIHGETILDNITAYNSVVPRTTLADMVKKNKNLPIYIIVPNKVSQAYLKNSSKDICLSHPFKLSNSIIYKVDLKESDSCHSGPFIISNRNSIATPSVGDFMSSKNDQLLLLSRNPQNTKNEYMQILDFRKELPGEIKYNETSLETGSLTNLPNINSTILAGDFMDLGYSQVLFRNRDPNGDNRIVVEDFSQKKSPAIIRYSEVLGDNSTLKELFDLNNTLLAGDFQVLGYSQVLVIDHNSKDGKLAIVDFRKGIPYVTEISEIGDDLIPIDSLLDHGDIQFAGDFMGLGYSQVLFINRNHTKAGNAKIIIVDFSKASPSVGYLEKWGESSLFSGWLDANDTQLLGDFLGLGHSQVLFVNHQHKEGKIMITDFSQGKPSIKFWESWDKGIVFQGWLDINDTRVAGDFAGLGYDQILFLNSSLNGIRATIVDLKNGIPIPL